jgi:hypothetical protein
MKKFIYAVLAAASAQPVLACDLCSVYAANEARGEIGKGVFAGVAEQFTRFGTLQEDGLKVPNDANQSLDSSVTQILFGYNFNEHVGVQFNAPIIHRSFQRADGFDIDRGTESGIGDVSLVGHAQLIRHESKNQTFAWNVLGGVKFPAGSTRRLQEEVAELTAPPPPPGAPESGIHGHDLALGSGSYDGIIGTSVFARYKRVFLGASAQYTIRSKGDFDYQFANDLTWSGGPGALLVLNERFTLSLQANVSGETKDKDDFQGAKADDTGITSIYLGPEILLTWRGKLSAEFGVDVPVRIDNTALQIVPDWRVRGALTWHF